MLTKKLHHERIGRTENFSGCGSIISTWTRTLGEWLNDMCSSANSTSSTNLFDNAPPWIRQSVSLRVPSLERVSEVSCEADDSCTETSQQVSVASTQTEPPGHHKEKPRDSEDDSTRKNARYPTELTSTDSIDPRESNSSLFTPRHKKHSNSKKTLSKSPTPAFSHTSQQSQNGVETTAQIPKLMFKISSQQPITIAISKTNHKTVMHSQHVTPTVGALITSASSYPVTSDSSGIESDLPEDVQLNPQASHGYCYREFSDFELECLLIHNEYRDRHGVPPLTLNKEMCNLARVIALALCGKASLPSFPDRKYGEIILVSKTKKPVPIHEACQKWYEQIENYEFGVEPKATKSRKNIRCHFTQMIWRNTKELGIGTAHDGDNTNAIVALYYPAGNVPGQFVQNCPRPQDWCTLENIEESFSNHYV